MKREIKQFFEAWKAKINASDEDFIRKYLNPQEQILFYRQRIFDQRHALNTAYKVVLEVERSPWLDKSIVIKAALLHDVGKALVYMPLWVKPTNVLMKKYAPRLLSFLAQKGSKPIARLLYRYFYAYEFHAEIGDQMLAEIGVEKQVRQIVSMHHEPPMPSEPKELPIFRRADSGY